MEQRKTGKAGYAVVALNDLEDLHVSELAQTLP